MTVPILLASDLDRTLLPNGGAPESPRARDLFRQFVARPQVRLVYVTGRDLTLARAAMEEYALPRPDFIIADVGTRLFAGEGDDWQEIAAWKNTLARDWNGRRSTDLMALLQGVAGLRLQEEDKQTPRKLSYYAAPLETPGPLLAEVHGRLKAGGVQARLVWSNDETTATGLLDVLPATAGKLPALEFLRARLNILRHRTVFAGDSGNDMDILESGIPSVLVANADDAVRTEALARAPAASLYLARGGLLDMNGNYSAGVLEGVIHFFPGTRAWLTPPG